MQTHRRPKPQKQRINDGPLLQSNCNSSAVQLTTGLERRLTTHSKQIHWLKTSCIQKNLVVVLLSLAEADFSESRLRLI
jgi:hypothetical protein